VQDSGPFGGYLFPQMAPEKRVVGFHSFSVMRRVASNKRLEPLGDGGMQADVTNTILGFQKRLNAPVPYLLPDVYGRTVIGKVFIY